MLAKISLCLGILCRWLVSLGSYSGEQSPPMRGDFEAQRHWLEITFHLDTKQWYRYDLQYWGLDYPPLTAYHSLVLGYIAHWINPDWIALDESRGIENMQIKTFMRLTSLLTELIIYLPALVLYCYRSSITKQSASKGSLFLLIFLQPALMIIDHGHFQYNSAMLGFTLWAIVLVDSQRYVLAAIAFCLALCFKQMALYYALPIFFYLLGHVIRKGQPGFGLLVQLGLAVIFTMGVCFAPFLSSAQDVGQVIHRIFPLQRGLYEDKVGNVWCAVNVVMKLRELFPQPTLVKMSIATTLAGLLPSNIALFLRPTTKNLLYGLANGSLSFFLFSYQVHEKSILLPALPITLLLLEEPDAAVWFNNVALFSMYPLIKKDGLILELFALVVLWNALISINLDFKWNKAQWLIKFSYLVMVMLLVAEFFIPAPSRYPDIFPVLNAVISCGHFLVFLGYFTAKQFYNATAPTKKKAQ